MGQGVHTVLRQIACEEPTFRPSASGVLVSTERSLTPARRRLRARTVLGGNAVLDAARKLKAALDGHRSRRSPGRSSAASSWSTGPPRTTPRRWSPILAYSWATQVVTLDDEGRPRKVIAAHDVGRAINPTLVEGQIEGAVHMGLGQALSEEFVVEGGAPVTETLKSLHIIPPTGMPESSASSSRSRSPRARSAPRASAKQRSCPLAAVAGALRTFDGIRRTRLPMKDSPAALAAVPHLTRARKTVAAILTGATVVSSLDPLHIVWEDVHVAGGRIAASGCRTA